MRKIPNLFLRDETGRSITTVPNPVAQWVFDGEGVATRKWDGTACLVRDGLLYKRYDAKQGKPRPDGFEPCGEPDPITGHDPGWVRVGFEPESKWHLLAWADVEGPPPADGTYELIGPKIGKNPEHSERHVFKRHGDAVLLLAPRTWNGLRDYLSLADIEGVVFHHPDGRMAKIRKADFGWKR